MTNDEHSFEIHVEQVEVTMFEGKSFDWQGDEPITFTSTHYTAYLTQLFNGEATAGFRSIGAHTTAEEAVASLMTRHVNTIDGLLTELVR